MNRDASLLGKIFEVTRGDLDAGDRPLPQIGGALSSPVFITVDRVSSFWKAEEHALRVAFEQCVHDFVAGLHGRGTAWSFLIEGSARNIKVRFGAESGARADALRSCLRGSFPDIRLSQTALTRDSDLALFKYASEVVGCPTSKLNTQQGIASDQIERVCRGLSNESWAFFVSANPLPRVETTRLTNDLMIEIRTTHETTMLKGSAIDEQNRLARAYLDLLEARLPQLPGADEAARRGEEPSQHRPLSGRGG